MENFTQELQGKYEHMETENTNLKKLVYKFMGGIKLITLKCITKKIVKNFEVKTNLDYFNNLN